MHAMLRCRPPAGMPALIGIALFVVPALAQDPPTVTPASGYYNGSLQATLSWTEPRSVARYTTNAREPTAADPIYTGPIAVTNNTVLRAATFPLGGGRSAVVTRTYLFPDAVLRQPATPAGFPTAWTTAGGLSVPADYAMDATIADEVRCNGLLDRALLQWPAVSLVTATSNLFDRHIGIYVNPLEEGPNWERPVSLGFFTPDGNTSWQVDAGLRIDTEARLRQVPTKKLSFRVLFKSQYGPSKLEQPLFPDPNAAAVFDEITLQGGNWDSWANTNNGAQAQYLRDSFARDLHAALGRPIAHTRPVHLYVDGLYWGLYALTEQLEGFWASTYFGGDADTWDVIHSGNARDGNLNAWNALLQQARAGLGSNAAYLRVQGRNPDNAINPAYPNLLDVPNYMDYLIDNLWAANTDWPTTNWFAARDANGSYGFRFFVHHADATLGINSPIAADLTGVHDGVAEPLAALVSNAEFRLQFGDRLQQLLFDEGELTAFAVTNRYAADANAEEFATLMESARWGDQRHLPAFTLANWQQARDFLLTGFLARRTPIFLAQCRAAGLYPSIPPPTIRPPAGGFDTTLAVSLLSSNTVYYSLDGSDPREPFTEVARGLLYTNPIVLGYSVHLATRARSGTNTWSTLVGAAYVQTAYDKNTPLRLSEIMYHPRNASAAESAAGWSASDFQFVELYNADDMPVGLIDVRFTAGITFDFATSPVPVLARNQYVLLVKNRAAFAFRYAAWTNVVIAGEFGGNLSNGGETLAFLGPLGNTVTCAYGNSRGWPLAADGTGHSLVANGSGQPDEHPETWRDSTYLDGSPGAPDPAPPAGDALVVNELAAVTPNTNAAPSGRDWIELFNHAASPVAQTNWFLSDNPDNLRKWALCATSAVPPASALLLNSNQLTGATFRLKRSGDRVYLSHLADDGSNRVVNVLDFPFQDNSNTWGRSYDGASFDLAVRPTPGASNLLLSLPTVRINEMMYHPPESAVVPPALQDWEEFIELYNPSTNAVILADTNGVWRLNGDTSFTFPAGTRLGPTGYIVIASFDPANASALAWFRSAYGLANTPIQLVGPFSGHLSNRGERLALERPVSPAVQASPPAWTIVDEVYYSDRGPWPNAADGSGSSLQRLPRGDAGDDPQSWESSLRPSPGGPAVQVVLTPVSDTCLLLCRATNLVFHAKLDPNFVTQGVAYVDFLLDGLVFAVSATGDYGGTLDGSQLPGAGPYTVSARFVDANGSTNNAPNTVPVCPCSPPDVGNAMIEVSDVSARATFPVRSTCGGDAIINGQSVTINGATASAVLTGLVPGHRYSVTCRAENECGPSTNDASSSFTTLAYDAWTNRMVVWFRGYQGSETLTNFPALLKLSDMPPGFSHASFGSPNGADLRFLAPGGQNALPCEIEAWNRSGTSWVWVLVPQLSGSRGYVTMLWGPHLPDGLPGPSGFDGALAGEAAVWHLDESPYYGCAYEDHAGFQNTGTFRGMTCTAVAGKILGAAGFSGNSRPDYIVVLNDGSFDLRDFSLSAWVRAPPAAAGRRTLFQHEENGDGWSVALQDGRLAFHSSLDGLQAASGPALNDNAWHQVAVTRAAARRAVWYVDGRQVGQADLSSPAAYQVEAPVELGRQSETNGYFEGQLDEVRIAAGARSSNWIWAAWLDQASNSVFAVYDTQAQDAHDDNHDGLPDMWSLFWFGATNAPNGGANDDWDHDGMRNAAEFAAGTDPTKADSRFTLNVVATNGAPIVTLPSFDGSSPGTLTRQRLYRIEQSRTNAPADWLPVPGWTNVPGRGSDLEFHPPSNDVDRFYRGATWLQ